MQLDVVVTQFLPAPPLAPATRQAYERDWRLFATWCAERGVVAIPAEPATVAAFLAAEADRGFRAVTIGRRAPRPGSAEPVRLRRRRRGDVGDPPRARHQPAAPAAPLELDPLQRLTEPTEIATLAGLRDRALLLLGFAAAMRRSELVALTSRISTSTPRGLKLTIGKSKTRPGAGRSAGGGAVRACERQMRRAAG